MHDQPKYRPLRSSTFFRDGRASRPLPEGTIAREEPAEVTPVSTGRGADGQLVAVAPVAVTRAMLERGRERYDVFCAVCHDRVGPANGIVVQRGFRRPPSLHEERLRKAADGYLFDVASRGFGVMPSYAGQITVADRWAIVAYVRALQLSQDAPLDAVPEPERARLAEGPR